jgi:hypothetical protein
VYVASQFQGNQPIPGSQSIEVLPDPYVVFGDLEAAEARRLYAAHDYLGAQRIFAALAARVPQPDGARYAALADLAAMYAAWDVLDFAAAARHAAALAAHEPAQLPVLDDARTTLAEQQRALIRLAEVASAVVRRDDEALRTLGTTLAGKHRSFRVAHLAQRARRALEKIAGADPAADPELAQSFDALMARVGAPPRSRLPLRLAMPLLLELSTAAFSRALALWQKQPAAPPAVGVLARQLEVLDDPELTLRLGALLCARPERDVSPEAAWTRRWRALQPHLEAHLIASGTTLKAHVQKLDAAGDAALAARLPRLR